MRRLPLLVACAAVGAVTAWLYAPALRLELMGDDYQWMQLARAALRRPALLLADLDTFWRPSSTWTLAATHLAAPFSPAAHHAVSLALHVACALLLLALGRRAGLSVTAAAAAAFVWASSPFASEPAISVASRHETLLLASWFALGLAWPGPDTRWSPGRAAGAAAAVLLAACSKETWVVTPGLALAYDLVLRRRPARLALRLAGALAVFAAAYAAVRFLAFPTLRGYFEASPALLTKVPHELAAFLALEGLIPIRFPFGWRSVVALAAVAAMAALVVARRDAAGVLGLALLVLPTIPTLPVPYLPTRYTAIPYAGFALLAVACLAQIARGAPGRARPWASVALAAAGALVAVAGAFGVRAELADAASLSRRHAALLAEARAAAPSFPLDRPVLVVRAERDNPVDEVALAVRGLPKLPYVRPPDPYGMVDAAALFEWVMARDGLRVVRREDGEARFRGRPGAILEHRCGGFVWIATRAADLGGEAEHARRAGLRYRVIEAEQTTAR